MKDGEYIAGLLSPAKIDMAQAARMGLTDAPGQLSRKYFQVQKVYQQLLELYLARKTSMDIYDHLLKNGRVKFNLIAEAKKDIYQSNSRFQYFYVRNTLHIERLCADDIEYLLLMADARYVVLNEVSIRLIERTLAAVIRLSSSEKERHAVTNYGPISSQYFGPMDGMVIGIRYEPYEDQNNPDYYDDKWFENNIRQGELLQGIAVKLKKEIEDALGLECAVIAYGDAGVMPLKEQ